MNKKRRKKPPKTQTMNTKQKKAFFRFLFATGILVISCFLIVLMIPHIIAWIKIYHLPLIIMLSLVVIFASAYFINRLRKKRIRRDSVVDHIMSALKIMDSIGHHFTNEEEANKELVGILKSQGLEVDYQTTDNFGKYDAIVDGFIIEGKLDLYHTSAIDRLIGQLQRYSQSNRRVCVVIYGGYNPDCLKRIAQVTPRFPQQIQTAFLPSAHRKR